MRAASGRAETAPRVIARTSRRVDICLSPRCVPKVADQGEFRVNPIWAGLLLTEGPGCPQGYFSAFSARSAFFSSLSALPVTFGYSSFRPSSVSMMAAETTSQATCLWSAGTTYHGA